MLALLREEGGQACFLPFKFTSGSAVQSIDWETGENHDNFYPKIDDVRHW